MPFEKGHKKMGGRKKGTPNKYSDEMRGILKQIFFKEVYNIPEILESLPPEKRLDVFLKLMPYFFPKITSVGMGINEPLKFPTSDQMWRD